MGRVDNKVAIVTGAAGGMGKADALLLAREGAKVVITDLQLDKLLEVVSEITEQGGEAIGFQHDVASEDDWARVVDETIAKYGKIDILVNNAGISDATPFLDQTVERWERTMSINVTSVFLGQKYVIPHMIGGGGGSIVNISSIAGLTGGSGSGPYTASKGAVRMLTKATAVDYARYNIRANSIHPGYIETPMTIDMFKDEKMRQWFQSQTPLPRLGKAEDIAQGVLFLASDESSYITGVELPIDGGYYAK
ncbi:NAD(P)-dependent dehydrogenase, short-chain alcohol dehydrogenase family [Paenibacillus sp. UNCCL117]|uniref:SDR family NAD(P)-dependent oxidoreductase n=1 Tax=unclassified Paenibacillus TaxID=185978 RepID=UPI00088E337E|nr:MULTISPECIES: glucose 1-dehydrogenase [unclassified Paenibacillus]SDD68310.1 NAD(P)-dependent dehydrogenase, short-chain alcohol dehydrogenase family [Paenibacillus sp. cl123]SFW70985.1 NAD(P)-dependent dehydrogenase, short-chain alcohol dehydrogenase family [Paenibacillus sp. UNCCL117]